MNRLAPHGTKSAYDRHLRRDHEPACDACKRANTVYYREYYHRTGRHKFYRQATFVAPVTLTVNLERSVKDSLSIAAKAEHLSVSAFVAHILTSALNGSAL